MNKSLVVVRNTLALFASMSMFFSPAVYAIGVEHVMGGYFEPIILSLFGFGLFSLGLLRGRGKKA